MQQALAGSRRLPTGRKNSKNYVILESIVTPTDRASVVGIPHIRNKKKTHYGRTDGQTDGPTDGWTDPLSPRMKIFGILTGV